MEDTVVDPMPEASAQDVLVRLRERIDALDDRIVETLADRYRLAEEVGRLKRTHALPPMDPGREAGIVRRAGSAARRAGIPEEGVRRMFWLVLEYCRGGVRRVDDRGGVLSVDDRGDMRSVDGRGGVRGVDG